jgi:hypothetical protein
MRPRLIMPRHDAQLRQVIKRLQKKAAGNREVSAKAILSAWRAKVCGLRTLRRWLQRNFRWCAPVERAKPSSPAVEARAAFLRKWGAKPASYWRSQYVVFADGHRFPRRTTQRHIDIYRQQAVRGNYREIATRTGQPVKATGWEIRAKRTLRQNVGGTHNKILSATGKGNTHVFSYKSGKGGWNAATCCRWLDAIVAHFGVPRGGRKLTVFVDRDPVWAGQGPQGRKVRAHAASLGAELEYLPPQSPDMMLWDHVGIHEAEQRLTRLSQRTPVRGAAAYDARIAAVLTHPSYRLFISAAMARWRDHLGKISPADVER